MACNCKRQAMNVAEDIISDLPREIVDYILERMPIRDVARTSTLSRKWRYIWTTHPQLKFDNQFYKENIENKPFTLQNFVYVITKIFLLHNGPIMKFSLHIPSAMQIYQNPDIDHWILILSRNGIKELDFKSANPNPYKLPSYIFSCPQLTHLKLSNCIIKPPHAFKGFPNLIILTLENIIFATNTLGTLFSSAPLLESLIILGCSGIEHFNIHAPALKAMHIMAVRDFKSISLKNSPYLTAVSIAPCSDVDQPIYPYSGKTTNSIEFLASLPRIVTLLLDSFVLKVLVAGTISKSLPGVKNLKRISLITINFNDFDEISCIIWLLEHSTNLQELHIRAIRSTNTVMQPVFNFLKEPCWKGLEVNTLRTVKLTLNKCLRAELVFIEFLLDRCLILERMSIEFSLPWVDANEGFRVLKEVMRFPRASHKAQVIFE